MLVRSSWQLPPGTGNEGWLAAELEMCAAAATLSPLMVAALTGATEA